jgi:hypothetical protein
MRSWALVVHWRFSLTHGSLMVLQNGMCALTWAAIVGHEDLVDSLLSAGASLEVVDVVSVLEVLLW